MWWQGCCLQKNMDQLLLPHLQWLMWQCLQTHILVSAAALPEIKSTQDGLLTACCRLGWPAGVMCLNIAMHREMLGDTFQLCVPDELWLSRS